MKRETISRMLEAMNWAFAVVNAAAYVLISQRWINLAAASLGAGVAMYVRFTRWTWALRTERTNYS